MHKMLSIIVLQLALAYCSAAQGSGIKTPEVKCSDTFIVGKKNAKNLVFFGADQNMPSHCRFLISNHGKYSVPRSNADALSQFTRGLPRWIVAAIANSSGDDECVVRVNDVDYFSLSLDAVVQVWLERSSDERLASVLAKSHQRQELAEIEFLDQACKQIKSDYVGSTHAR